MKLGGCGKVGGQSRRIWGEFDPDALYICMKFLRFKILYLKNCTAEASKRTRWANVLVTRSDNLSSVPANYVVEGEN